MHFDWYQATIDVDVNTIIDHLGSEAGDAPDQIREGKGRHNYSHSTALLDGNGERIFEMLHGGKNGAPNVTASGHYAAWFAETVRTKWPHHRVSRLDVAQDVVQEGAYERMEAVCRDVSKRGRVKGLAMVPEDIADGRTYYLGSKASDRQVRLYDKTAEVRSKSPRITHADVPEHWTRIELQWRPKKHDKDFAALWDVESCWFTGGWTAAVARRLLDLDLNRINGAPWKPDPDRAMMFLIQQYGRHLEKLAEKAGGWAAAGEQLGSMVEARRRHSRL